MENVLKCNYNSNKKLEDISERINSLEELISSSSFTDSSSSDYDSKSFYEQQKQQIIDSNWGGYALDLNLWNDFKSPVTMPVQMPSELLLDEDESRGFLSEKLIRLSLSFLTRSPENGLYILSKCVIQNRNLIDISMLQNYRYLQYIDIAHNKISNLSPLSNLSYLMYLKASHNKIRRISNFTPPWYLTYVNLSYNCINSIGDLKKCWSIVRLNLSHNLIQEILDLENLKYLQYLDLSYNLIECIQKLDNLNIQVLNLEGNCIRSFKSDIPGRGLNTLLNLRTIMLGYNKLSTLEFFKDAYNLRYVDLRYNKISSLLEVLNLKSSIFEVNFTGNPCTKWPNYRNVLISTIPRIKFIDGIDVFPAEKVTSATLFASPVDLIAARQVAKLMLLEQLNITKINQNQVQSYDEISPPLIVLTGPLASKKTILALNISQAIPDKVKYCCWHCTKDIYDDDYERDVYILVNRENFNDMARRGEFLVILDQLGHSFGFHTSHIASMISENKIGITQMNLYAVTEISRRYSNVKAILAITNSVDIHADQIEEKFNIYTWIKDSMEDLLVVKIGKKREYKEVETTSCILNFIVEILDEVIAQLDLPTYSIYVRPQGTATTTDVIRESMTMLPRITLLRSEYLPAEKIYIDDDDDNCESDYLKSEMRKKELKVLLDEQSKIIVDDKKTLRDIHKSKMMERRNILLSKCDDFEESITSIEETRMFPTDITFEEKTKILKDTYIEIIIKSRKLYLDYHENYPGFFTMVLIMDNYTEAFDSLKAFILDLYEHSYIQPIFLSMVNQFTQAVIPSALKNIINEIKENLSTSELQKKAIFKMQK